jgi:uncharacterized protein
MELLDIIVLLVGGFIAGLYASTAGGGSFVSFPVLLFLGMPLHVAIATNRFSALFLCLTSTARFLKEKVLDLRSASLLALVAGVASFIGANIVLTVDERPLSLIIAAVMTFAAVAMFVNKDLGLKKRKGAEIVSWKLVVGVFILGIYGGFFGGAVGVLYVLALVLGGYDFLHGAAVARMIGIATCIAASAVFIYHGLVDFEAGILLGLGYGVGGWIGAGIGVKKGNKYIRALFFLVVGVTVAKLLSGL